MPNQTEENNLNSQNQNIAGNGDGFWHEENSSDTSTQPVEHFGKRYSEQINKLQQKQLELVQQTAQELEELKRQLEDNQDFEEKINNVKAPLLNEITQLRSNIGLLEKERNELSYALNKVQRDYAEKTSRIQETLGSLNEVIRSQARAFDNQIKTFSTDANRSMENMLDAVEDIHVQFSPIDFTANNTFISYSTPVIASETKQSPVIASEARQSYSLKDQSARFIQKAAAVEQELAKLQGISTEKSKEKAKLNFWSKKGPKIIKPPKIEQAKEKRHTELVSASKKEIPKQVRDDKKVHDDKPIDKNGKKVNWVGVRQFTVKSIGVLLICTFAYSGYIMFAPQKSTGYIDPNLTQNIGLKLSKITSIFKLHSKESGTVAGISIDATPVASTNQNDTGETQFSDYPESVASIDFDYTVWDTVKDIEFGISMDYPKNTTNRVRILGGSNLWFLRYSGYMMKFTKTETKLSLTDWWTNNKQDYIDGNTDATTTFKGEPAVKMTSNEKTKTSGTTYFQKRGDYIIQIWVKDEDPNSDDGKRLERMVNSLVLSTPQS